ncbi:MAG: hypothetical protein ACOCRX_03405 [Candidatus Woesearchaeota archaeon]
MKKRDVDNILLNSSSEDWIKDEETGNFTYKKDLNLRVERQKTDEIGTFKEEWATDFPDSNAESIEHIVKYNNSFVYRKLLVSVDGGRALLPMPESHENLAVTEKAVNFAKLVCFSGPDKVDEYLERANFNIVPDESYSGWGF